MQKKDREKFAILMGMLATVFEKGEIRKEKIQIYEQFLGNIPIVLLEKGIIKIINNRKFPGLPLISEIREACFGIDDKLEREALEAWGRVRSMAYPRDELTLSAIKMTFGNWEAFENGDPDQDSYDRNQFLKCYKLLAKCEKENLTFEEAKERKELESWQEYKKLNGEEGQD